MKKLMFAILCLFLTGCGEFVVNVRIVPPETPITLGQASAAPPGASTSATLSAASLTPVAAALQTENPQETDSSIPVATMTPTQGEPSTTAASIQATPTSITLQAGQSITLTTIQMNDTSHGWAVESSGHIIKTGDGGLTWKNATPFEGVFDTHSLFAFDNETVWAISSQPDVRNVVWHTQDGGETWEASQPIPLGTGRYSPLGLQFPDARNGWLLLLARNGTEGNHVLLYKSRDGGESWEQVSSLLESVHQSYLPNTHTTMAFFDGQTGWLGGWWGRDNPHQWTVLKTVDGGANWETEAIALPDQSSLTCNGRPITEIAPGAMAVDMSCTLANDPTVLHHYLSVAGSPAWRSWKLTGKFLSVDFLNANQGWMMTAPGGPLNEIYRTNNGGKTWVNINVVAWKQASFNFVTGQTGWAIVSDGKAVALVHTINGGRSWTEIKPVVAGR